MKSLFIAMAVVSHLLCGCAALLEQTKQDEYDRTMYAYETALQLSDFDAICRFADPETLSRKNCISRFGDIKIVNFKQTDMKVSDDRSQVQQEIEIEYHALKDIVLQKKQFSQSWIYRKDTGKWVLENGPPPIP
ncbi:MAG: hypothetical protein CSA23_07995 [Deltaproteobacteria bacterium]|nr:MAG: hypothetical protein CSA23_07995 [Deltaproteobacteria bacterium]